MKRLKLSLAFLSVPAALAALSGCAAQECASLGDCGGGQMCSPDGACVADPRPEFSGSNGAIGLIDVNGDDDEAGIGNVVAPGEAIWTGAIGPIGGFDGPATLSLWSDEAWGMTTINITGESDEGFGLFIMNLAEDLPVGSSNLTAEDANTGGSYVQLCSDNENIHFDGIPEETVINVEPNEEGFAVDVKTTITNGFDGANQGGGTPAVLRVQFQLTQ